MAGNSKESKSGSGAGGLLLGLGVLGAGLVVGVVIVLVSAITLITAMVQANSAGLCSGDSSSPTSWVAAAKQIADDDKHGYSQPNRGGNPDFDCSSLVWYALKQAGFDVGSTPFYTGNEGLALIKAGFEKISFNRDNLQTGDILWNPGHTEIYAGDNKVVTADHDENGGIQGRTPGDQTGKEITVRSLYENFQAVYRLKGGVQQAVSGSTQAAGTSGSTGAVNPVGLDENGVRAWFGGQQGPNNICAAYAYGQCTWYACIRGYKIGWKGIGSHWGNGQDWARSAAKAGFKTTKTAPVAGALMSVPAGLLGSSRSYGHVLVVESVDTAKGTITTSEKGAGYKVYSRTLPIKNGGTYILPNSAITGTGASGSGGSVEQCAVGDPAGDNATGGDAKAIAKKKVQEYGWDDSQYQCLVQLWEHESNWNVTATNPTSGAYGIPQALPGSKMASAGQDWKTNAATQITWGLTYIRQRYKTPCSAWATWQSRSPHWY
ncbi:hypothetical protein COO72_10505 [Bifidobacterium callitrichos]|nr:hypothetical protein COO72_10505 [Bifidobacterium callitrichos]